MKIVVVDGDLINLGDISWDPLYTLGEVTILNHSSIHNSDIFKIVGDADIAVLHQSCVTEELIESCGNLKYICITSVGFDEVTMRAMACAKNKGIPISNVASYGPAAIAQHALALMLELTNHAGDFSHEVAMGRWRDGTAMAGTKNRLSMMELSNKTLGIIGYGRIGSYLGKYARALGMHVITYSPYSGDAAKEEMEHVALDVLLTKSDVISVHCPLTAETYEIINRDSISKMKEGAMLINTARGGLVNEEDLADALKCKKIRAAADDVVSKEPIR